MSIAWMLAGAALAAGSVSPEAQQAKDQAESLKKSGDLAGAEQAYRRAIGLSPSFAIAHNDLGSLLFEGARIPEAVDEFNQAVKADPTFPIAWFNLGFASRKVGNFGQAVDAYRHYSQLKPDDTDGWYGLGEACRNANQRGCAIEGYQTYLAKQRDPKEQKWIDKANGYLADLKPAGSAAPAAVVGVAPVGSTEPAAVVTTPAPVSTGPSATTLGVPSPNNTVTHTKIAEGDQLFGTKQYREALFAYQDAVNADPSNVEALFDLGRTYAVMGYFQQAIDRWTRVLEVSHDPAIRSNAESNIAKAEAKMQGISSPPTQGQAHAAPAPALVATQAPAAPASAPAVVASDPERARQRYEAGVTLIGQKQYQQAADAFSEALRLNPSFAQAYAARGSAHVGLRQFPEAVEDYQASLRLDANMATPLFGAAEAYRAMGRKQDAALYYQRYADSRSPDASVQLQVEAKTRALEMTK